MVAWSSMRRRYRRQPGHSLSKRLDSHELVADASHGDEAARMARVGLELPPKIRGVHVDCAPVPDEAAVQEVPRELVAREDAPGLRGEQRHEPELRPRQRQRL